MSRKRTRVDHRRRYVGGLAVEMVLPSGREISVAPGDVVELLPNEAEAVDVRPDFEAVADPEPSTDPAEAADTEGSTDEPA